MSTRIFSIVLIAVLTVGLMPTPVKAAPAAITGNATGQLIRADGTLELGTGYTGSLSLDGYNVTLDPLRGPLLNPESSNSVWQQLDSIYNYNTHIYAVAVSGTDVYVGGSFTDAGGNPNADYIAKWDGSTWSSLGSGYIHNDVYAIGILGGSVYAGGRFSNAGSNEGDLIAEWSGSSWSALDSGISGYAVNVITINNSDIYVGGNFDSASGVSNTKGITKWDALTLNWSAVGTGLNGGVNDIEINGADLYAGGTFLDAGGDPNADTIAKWNGTNWLALGTGLNADVNAIGISGTDIYAAGYFTDAGGNVEADYIAKWDGTAWSALGTAPFASSFQSINAIAIDGTNVYVGGTFYNAGGDADADHIARWDGTTWSAVGDGLANPPHFTSFYVYALTMYGSDLYAVGEDYLYGYVSKFGPDTTPPVVKTSDTYEYNPTSAATVEFLVTFSDYVTGVDKTDFQVTASGITGAAVTNVDEPIFDNIEHTMTFYVTVKTGSGNGVIRLDVLDNDSVIDAVGNPLGGPGTGNGKFTAGKKLTVRKIPIPVAPATKQLDNMPTFQWMHVPESTKYEYQLYLGAVLVYTRQLSSVNCNPPTCETTPNFKLPSGAYRWRVRGMLNNAWTAYSPFKTFTMAGPEAGYWNTTGAEMYVSPDHLSVYEYTAYVIVPACNPQRYKIVYKKPIPILHKTFSHTGNKIAFSFTGTFTSQTRSTGSMKFYLYPIPYCGLVSGGPFTANHVWKNANQAAGEALQEFTLTLVQADPDAASAFFENPDIQIEPIP